MKPAAEVWLHPACCTSPRRVRAAQEATGRTAVFVRRRGPGRPRCRVALVEVEQWRRRRG